MPEVHVLPDAVSSENVDRVVSQAIYEFRAQKAENKRRLHLATRGLFKFEGFGGVCKATMLAGTLVLVLLIADGSRRDSGEFAAVVNSCDAGVVSHTAKPNRSGATAIGEQARLFAADGLQTPSAGEATLGFADGSGIIVGPQSRMDISCLDFARDGRRDRALFLHEGRATVRVSPHFGANQSLFSTPGGIVAARSGSAYGIAFDAKTNRCDVDVVGGTVVVRTAWGRKEVKPGERAIWFVTNGSTHAPAAPVIITRARTGKLSQWEARANGAEDADELITHFAQLAQKNKRLQSLDAWGKPGVIQKWERMVMKTLDPALQKVGLTAHGFSLADNDGRPPHPNCRPIKTTGRSLRPKVKTAMPRPF